MRFIGDYKIASLTFFIIALSIYLAIYGGINVDRCIAGFRRFFVKSPDITTANRSHRRSFSPEDGFPGFYMSISEDPDDRSFSLQYDYYRESCPSAERIIRRAVGELQNARPSVAPSLIRLLFHDCFIEGCDASILLDPDESFDSEKDSPPNQSLKGFDVIDTIKEELEDVCPGIVSCSDLLALAARESVLLMGGPFYPLYTGRKDSLVAFGEMATYDIPSPQADLSEILANFASRGFDARETVSLLGAHSIGITHCQFFENRLYNFSGTGKPDPSLDPVLLQELKTKCQPENPSPAPLPSPYTASAPSYPKNTTDQDQIISMTFGDDSAGGSFGTRYFRRLLRNRGLLFADQQLTAREETAIWVKAYASAPLLFRRDFAISMMRLSNLHVLTGPLGQVRRNCSKVAPVFA
ncbi:PREDICTED: putative Peroxidase 48 [Tarenaya hassleriana]|uniref:putative Peroxidase 48 n=1 Tax=Tarenaya hassleriana TaxID=28532 RepID=UPI00053C9CC5|nr:PREDICTED: putative Peroxidase 48 [Tarenaya hassleriana]